MGYRKRGLIASSLVRQATPRLGRIGRFQPETDDGWEEDGEGMSLTLQEMQAGTFALSLSFAPSDQHQLIPIRSSYPLSQLKRIAAGGTTRSSLRRPTWFVDDAPRLLSHVLRPVRSDLPHPRNRVHLPDDPDRR